MAGAWNAVDELSLSLAMDILYPPIMTYRFLSIRDLFVDEAKWPALIDRYVQKASQEHGRPQPHSEGGLNKNNKV
ncbi:hypothetical protein TSUD_185300 [Trifolium subterraneum]|uniref:Uncharacterized protein n=1 Tax=Trifolium subterraneum TaxID=3900 RepID=A0A2Z6P142_TRISU|nr:hypothetical protein TSUD_185300 [Trifolium subterraneum]